MLWQTGLPDVSSSQQAMSALACCHGGAWPALSAADRLAGGFCRPHHSTSQGQQLRLSALGGPQSRSLSTSLSDDQRPPFRLHRQRTGLSDWGAAEAARASAVASAVRHAERVSSHGEASTSKASPPR